MLVRRRIGIDPGIRGGIALISDGEAKIYPMPLQGSSTALQVDVLALNRLLRLWLGREQGFPTGEVTVFVETQNVIGKRRVNGKEKAGQGIVSSGRIMLNFGKIVGMLEAGGWPTILVNPLKWKYAAGVIKKTKGGGQTKPVDRKRVSVELAQRLYPQLADQLACKTQAELLGTKGAMAEALLIARFGEPST